MASTKRRMRRLGLVAALAVAVAAVRDRLIKANERAADNPTREVR